MSSEENRWTENMDREEEEEEKENRGKEGGGRRLVIAFTRVLYLSHLLNILKK